MLLCPLEFDLKLATYSVECPRTEFDYKGLEKETNGIDRELFSYR